eukprot:gene8217-16894_t
MWESTVRDVSTIHSKCLLCIRWNHDGTYIAGSSTDRDIRIGQYDPVTGSMRVVQSIPMQTSVTDICWHPQEVGRFAIIGSSKIVEVWDVRGTRAVAKLNSLGNNIHAAWSPNGQYFAVGNNKDNLHIFDMKELKQVRRVAFKYEVNGLAWTVNSDHFMIAYGGKSPDQAGIELLRLGGASAGIESVQAFGAHNGATYILQVDPTYRRIALTSSDSLVSLWDLEEMVCYRYLQVLETVRAVSFSPDGMQLALAGDSLLIVCDVVTGEVLSKIDCKTKIMSMCWHPTLPVVAVALDDKDDTQRFRDKPSPPVTLKLYTFNSGAPISTSTSSNAMAATITAP